MLKFIKGRQGGGYYKMPLLLTRWFDSYLLKFPEGSHIKPHIDPIKEGYEHYRLNIIIRKGVGGQFICKKMIFETDRIKFFRSDINLHEVKRVVEGTRWVLSIGWARKSK